MERLSARPHHVGAPYTKDNAEWMVAKFREWGWNANIETYDVLFPTPKERLLEMMAPTSFTAKLEEPAVAVDPTSGQKSEQLPTYNAYSIDGDVTAPLVYVNYGGPEDYEELDALGVSSAARSSSPATAVVARHQAQMAAEHGAIGCLIYSDPRDDGYFGDAVSRGTDAQPRRRAARQRDGLADLFRRPADAGCAGDAGHQAAGAADVPTLTKIPVLPISYGDAQPLLAALGGPVAPVAWRGALPITYRIGPGPARVRLEVAFNWDTRPIYNVIATLRIRQFPSSGSFAATITTRG